MKKIVPFLILFLGLHYAPPAQTVRELLESAEKLIEINNDPLALTKLEKVISLDPDNFPALYKSSLLYSSIGSRYEDPDLRESYFKQGSKNADKAIQVSPDRSEGYFAKAIALEQIEQISTSKDRYQALNEIKVNAMYAIRYNIRNAGAWVVLGRWHYRVSEMKFTEKAAANLIFGGLTDGASQENAIRAFTIALDYDGQNVECMYNLAQAFYAVHDRENCKKYLLKAIASKARKAEDPIIQQRCRKMLGEI